MPSINTKPFVVETWSVEGWTDGWSLARPYDAGGNQYALLLKESGYGGDDSNVHIHPIGPDGRLGVKLFSKRWTAGWSTCEFYTIGGQTYAFLLKRTGYASDGNNVHINIVSNNGDIGARRFSHKWTPGWTLARFYAVGGKQYLFLLKAVGFDSDGNNVHIHEVNADGSIGPTLHAKRWSSGWSTAEFYQAGGNTYLFLLKWSGAGSDGNNVHMHVIDHGGDIGARVESHEWSSGWSSARAFVQDGIAYLFLLKASNGRVHVRHIRVDGTLGEIVCAYDRDPGYTSEYKTGSLATRGPLPWSSGWTDIAPVEIAGRAHILCLKRQLTGAQEKRAKLVAIHPMSTVGPHVGFATDTTVVISMAMVLPPTPLKVVYRTGALPEQAVPMALGPSAQGYYRAASAKLSGLAPGTEYSFRIETAANVALGSGTVTTARPQGRGVVTVAVASCMDLSKDRVQNAWTHLLGKDPDLLILLGDNAYPNTTMRSMIWAEHLQQRGVAAYAEVARQVPTVAIWDDHDFGPNNSSGADKERGHRDESAAAFRELFPGLPFAQDKAIYYAFRWGDIEFFMLDVRYYRTYYRDGYPFSRRILGDDQCAWLETGLAASSARFKVIATGTTLDSGVTETWAEDYPIEWHWFKDLVARYAGVVIISGDNHRCEFQAHSLDAGKTLPEFIASGIGKGEAEHGFVTLTFDTSVAGSEHVIGRLFRQNGTKKGPDIGIPL